MSIQKLRNGSRQRGFTLIELSIVIAIIGILAALCIPRLWFWLERGKVIKVISTARCIHSAFGFYATKSLNNSYPFISAYQDIAVVANTNGCVLPYLGNPLNPPMMTFISYDCFTYDPFTGSRLYGACTPDAITDYTLRLGVPGVTDTLVEVDSISGVVSRSL